MWLWIGLAALATLVSFVAVYVAYVNWPPGPEQAYIDAYRVSDDGSIFEVQYTSPRDCDETLWARAHESDTTVVVDVAYRGFGKRETHDDMARLCQATIPLADPLGERLVTNTAGEPVSAQWMMVAP